MESALHMQGLFLSVGSCLEVFITLERAPKGAPVGFSRSVVGAWKNRKLWLGCVSLEWSVKK